MGQMLMLMLIPLKRALERVSYDLNRREFILLATRSASHCDSCASCFELTRLLACDYHALANPCSHAELSFLARPIV